MGSRDFTILKGDDDARMSTMSDVGCSQPFLYISLFALCTPLYLYFSDKTLKKVPSQPTWSSSSGKKISQKRMSVAPMTVLYHDGCNRHGTMTVPWVKHTQPTWKNSEPACASTRRGLKQAAEPALVDLGVPYRRRDRAVSEVRLYQPEVSTLVDQLVPARVPQHVRMDAPEPGRDA